MLLALEKQTYKDFEVIISEDNNAKETVEFINDMRKRFSFPIKHVSQEDQGFRKTKILNKAVMAASGEYLVFLDGDCVPHRKLLQSYLKNLTPDTVCLGRRTYLNDKLTQKILSEKSIKSLNLLNVLFNYHEQIEHAIYIPFLEKTNSTRLIMGNNWAAPRQSILDINGFDEDYTEPGRGEDFDVDWRLRRKGLNFRNIKHQVITYHLRHPECHTPEGTRRMKELMEKKKKAGHIQCLNGINKLSE